MSEAKARIIIVGGGASGVLVTLNLARLLNSRDAGDSWEVVVIEETGQPGRGVAYATQDPNHLLNVRVSNMSAFPEDPDHFYRWLLDNPDIHRIDCPTPFCFVPRRIYGAYLAALFEGLPQERVRFIGRRAVKLSTSADGVCVTLDNDTAIQARVAILATGYDRKEGPARAPANAWSPSAIAGLRPDAAVLIRGTGLTMVDTVLSLVARGHLGPITAVSRRGLLPRIHAEHRAHPLSASEIPFGSSATTLLKWLRRKIFELASTGQDWRSAIDGLRPHTQAIWISLPSPERARFLRHLRSIWDVHRHRMAPSVATTISHLQTTGQLRILAGRILDHQHTEDRVVVRVKPRDRQECFAIEVDRMIDATGLPTDPRNSPNDVLLSLFNQNLARVDPLGLGLELASDGGLIQANGEASQTIFAVGPLTRGALWETVAIPDIRVQCARLAEDICTRLFSKEE